MPNRKRPNFVGVWLSDTGLSTLDDLATEQRLSRSGMVRALLAEAMEARRKQPQAVLNTRSQPGDSGKNDHGKASL